LLFKGAAELGEDFWEQHAKEMDSWQQEGRTFYKLTGPETHQWYSNQFLYSHDESHPFYAQVREVNDDQPL